MPKIIIQLIIAVARLTAARVLVECLPATITSPTPIRIKPKFPRIIGPAIFAISFI